MTIGDESTLWEKFPVLWRARASTVQNLGHAKREHPFPSTFTTTKNSLLLRQRQVVAQGDRSLSLSLGSKGLHLTLADRATKEYLWEHLRKMREQAREQAKASRITRAASIDGIGNMRGDMKMWVASYYYSN